MGGKEILEKLKWIILISFPDGKQKAGCCSQAWNPLFCSPRIPVLCQGPKMCWIRPGGFSTPQGVARVGGQGVRGMNPLCSRYPPQDTSNLGQLPAVPPPQLPQLRQKLGISLVG